jgi:hypothetical protein
MEGLMKRYSVLGVAMLFFGLCLPAHGEPSSMNGPFRFLHNKHPEKSNPHYKDGMHHKRTGNVRHAGKAKKS